MRRIVSILILIFAPLSAFSQITKYSNNFLELGVGARAYGMGQSVAASVNDVTSGYWNPAGLNEMNKKFDVSLMHSEQISQIVKYDYLGFSYKLDSLTAFGFTAIRSGVDDIQNTLELVDDEGNLDFDRVSYFSVADYAFIASLARKTIIQGLDYGVNFKVIRRIIGDFGSSWGFGLDAAIKYKRKNWNFAAVGRDITSTFNAWTFNEDEYKDVFEETGNVMPEGPLELTLPSIILAVAYDFKINERFSSVVEVDFNTYFDGKRNDIISSEFATFAPHMGIEIDYKNMVFLRGGVNSIQKIENIDGGIENSVNPAFGIGLNLWSVNIDYAMNGIGDISLTPYSHIISLSYAFSPN